MESGSSGIMECWNTGVRGMMHLKFTIPLFHHSTIPFLLAILILAAGCDQLPGKPTPKSAGSLRRKSPIFPNSTP